MMVTRTFTRKPGQSKLRYQNEIDTIEVSEFEIEEARCHYPTYPNVSRATLACHVGRMKGLVHAGGRRCVTTVN